MPNKFILTSIFASLVLSAAIFGFFYAWVCSTMWGLDAADPRIAIKAMQAMNASVRNGVFFPAFFLTPVALALTAILAMRGGFARAGGMFGLSAVIYLLFGLFLTMAINVPMNEALATVEVPQTVEGAQQVWDDYSPRWQFWNITRTIASGLSFVVALAGVLSLNSQRKGA